MKKYCFTLLEFIYVISFFIGAWWIFPKMSWILTLVKGANILQYVPQIHLRSSLTMKQSAVVVASIAGIATVVSAAVYFRRYA